MPIHPGVPGVPPPLLQDPYGLPPPPLGAMNEVEAHTRLADQGCRLVAAEATMAMHAAAVETRDAHGNNLSKALQVTTNGWCRLQLLYNFEIII